MDPNLPASAPVETAESAAARVAPELASLYQQVKSGANWFYWIAGLSIVNAVLAHSETKTQFVIGLAITQLIDALVAQIAPGMKWISLAVDAVFAGMLAFFGYQAGQAKKWAFYAGLAVFLLDCAFFGWICLKFGEVDKSVLLGGVFRAIALFSIFSGLAAAGKLHRLRASLGVGATTPQAAG